MEEKDLQWKSEDFNEEKMNKVISERSGKEPDAGGQQEQFEIKEKKLEEERLEEERIRLAPQAEEQKKKDEKEAEAAIQQIEAAEAIQVKIKSYASQKNIKIILISKYQ